MRSLATSDRRSARALSRVVARVSSRAHARELLQVAYRLGASPTEIVGAVRESPNFRNRRFEADEPSLRPRLRAQTSALLAAIRVHGRGRPVGAVPRVVPQLPHEAGDLAVTWYGHATTLLELDGVRILIDPVFGERVSPSERFGPRRLHPVPGSIEDIPGVDVVLISHDHYDHLDTPSIATLERTHRPHYVVPLGVDFHLRAWRVPAERITALDWRESTEVAGVRLTCTEARHNSGRGLVDSQTLWAGWAVHGPRHSAYYSGDSGTSKRFAHIGADLGPFDVTLLPIGAYDPFWPDLHLEPEQTVAAHRDVNRIGSDYAAVTADDMGVADAFIAGDQRIDTPGGTHEEGEVTATERRAETAARRSVLFPVHWATFNLAMHWWAEPMRRLRRAAAEAGVPVVSPRLGDRVDLTEAEPEVVAAKFADPWWDQCSAQDDRD
ncbi:MBL fold metallo-hydrolase [Intrasporangium calvum]|uniref:MBL fold metallo-hydrolase n=1 Tax=Intrasporangium calvum TaxID=53358 RepID=A0ABT5GDS5_9MICO|nr:MBL fold metallo-hydrolase [Intrasporangium calvum]MDC5696011.1 MBL fold metallo-hydrolase [Intrasporangium calvum]